MYQHISGWAWKSWECQWLCHLSGDKGHHAAIKHGLALAHYTACPSPWRAPGRKGWGHGSRVLRTPWQVVTAWQIAAIAIISTTVGPQWKLLQCGEECTAGGGEGETEERKKREAENQTSFTTFPQANVSLRGTIQRDLFDLSVRGCRVRYNRVLFIYVRKKFCKHGDSASYISFICSCLTKWKSQVIIFNTDSVLRLNPGVWWVHGLCACLGYLENTPDWVKLPSSGPGSKISLDQQSEIGDLRPRPLAFHTMEWSSQPIVTTSLSVGRGTSVSLFYVFVSCVSPWRT